MYYDTQSLDSEGSNSGSDSDGLSTQHSAEAALVGSSDYNIGELVDDAFVELDAELDAELDVELDVEGVVDSCTCIVGIVGFGAGWQRNFQAAAERTTLGPDEAEGDLAEGAAELWVENMTPIVLM